MCVLTAVYSTDVCGTFGAAADGGRARCNIRIRLLFCPLCVCVCVCTMLAGDKEGTADLPHHATGGVGDLLARAGGVVCVSTVLDGSHPQSHQGRARGELDRKSVV